MKHNSPKSQIYRLVKYIVQEFYENVFPSAWETGTPDNL